MKKLNLKNVRRGCLVAKSFFREEGGGIYWECLCDCGASVSVTTSTFNKRTPKYCKACEHTYRTEDLTGKKFGSWLVLRESYTSGRVAWLCKCEECGVELKIVSHGLLSGKATLCKSCSKKTHGMYYHSSYNTWRAMHRRCTNPKDTHFHNYGGRGISICKRWSDVRLFISDMGERPSKQHSIERINVNGNYKPSNCCWATAKDQANNRRTTVRIGGRTFGELSIEHGMKAYSLRSMYYNNNKNPIAVLNFIARWKNKPEGSLRVRKCANEI